MVYTSRIEVTSDGALPVHLGRQTMQALARGFFILWSSLAVSLCAQGSCLPFSSPELQTLDVQTETDPNVAIRGVQMRLATGARETASLLRAQLFAVLADAYTEQSQPDEAHAAIRSARAELEGHPHSSESNRLRLRLDLLEDQWLVANSDAKAAVAATTSLLDGLPDETLDRACVLSMRATAYDYLNEPNLAVADALDAYRLAKNGHWSNARLEAAVTLARKFRGAGLYPQAEQMIDEAIVLASTDRRTSLLATLEYERGIVLVNARRFTDARHALEKSNEFARQIGDRFSIAATNATLCWALINEGDLLEAERVCNSGDDDLETGHRLDLQTLLIGYRAQLDLRRDRPEAALAKLNKILTPEIHALLPSFEPSFYWERARALAALHRYREANADFIRMRELEDAADSAQRNRQVAVMSAMLASETLATANRQLKATLDLQQREVTLQRERRQETVTLAVAALAISGLMGYLLMMSRRHGQSLRRQEIILRSAGTHAPDAFLLFDQKRHVLFANRNLCDEGPVPVAGDPVISAVPGQIAPALTVAIDEAFRGGLAVNFPAVLPGGRNDPRHFEICVVPAIEHEHVVGGTLRSVDVTDQLEIERAVIDGASHERQRLSSELHEGIGQQLAGVLLLLGSALTVARRGKINVEVLLEEIIERVREGIDAARELARGLAPVAIGRGSLRIALDGLVSDVRRRLRIDVECICQLENIELSDLASDHLYCICREAITNAALHGHCRIVRLLVRIESDVLCMSIRDDGRGISSELVASTGLGVKMMAYRTRLLGGEFKITSPPREGTSVQVRVPLDRIGK